MGRRNIKCYPCFENTFFWLITITALLCTSKSEFQQCQAMEALKQCTINTMKKVLFTCTQTYTKVLSKHNEKEMMTKLDYRNYAQLYKSIFKKVILCYCILKILILYYCDYSILILIYQSSVINSPPKCCLAFKWKHLSKSNLWFSVPIVNDYPSKDI